MPINHLWSIEFFLSFLKLHQITPGILVYIGKIYCLKKFIFIFFVSVKIYFIIGNNFRHTSQCATSAFSSSSKGQMQIPFILYIRRKNGWQFFHISPLAKFRQSWVVIVMFCNFYAQNHPSTVCDIMVWWSYSSC